MALRPSLLALASLASLSAGCVGLSAERDHYRAGEAIRLRLVNRGPARAPVSCCPSVERQVGERWEEAQWDDARPGHGRRNPLRCQCADYPHLRPYQSTRLDV